MEKALIGMSGGVDSSVAAFLTQQAGYACIGATMRLFSNDVLGEDQQSTCCSLDDVEDAKSVARRMGMPHYTFNFQDAFRETVMDKFVRCYERGDTPSPCIDCNRYLKFGTLLHRAQELGCQYVVTGHYARIRRDPDTGRCLLYKAADKAKDQTYFLYCLTQEMLCHTLFPLGELTKPQVRAIAEEHGFVTARKHDSQDICFVPDGDYAEFIRMRTGKTYPHGAFLDTDGNVIGEHSGIIRYTIGQRKGLGVGFGERMYVCSKDMQNNTVTLSREDGLYSSRLTAGDFNWILWENAPSEPVEVSARTRYNGREAEATFWADPDGTVHVEFRKPQRAVTAGQAVVLYLGDIVVGGGTILSAE